jgi:DNA-binding SARP family transcriptional activator
MPAPWTIEMLGGFRARRGERVVERFRTHKTAALLAFLAHRGERPHPREELIEMLWPGAEPEAGRNSLSQALSALRAQLEPPGTPASSVLAATRAAVGLAPGAAATDARAFEEALARGDRAAAVALYAGPWRRRSPPPIPSARGSGPS